MQAIPTLKISISGVRGVVGDSLTPTLLARFAQAFGTYAGSGTIVVGRDTRTSGEMVRQAVFSGLLSSGCRVVDLDIVPVPTVQLAVRHRRAHGGIAITASNNPAEWNALKFIGPDGLFLGPGPARELLDIYHQGEYVKVAGHEMRSVERMPQAPALHQQAILDAVGALPAGARRIRVALDACNGAGSLVAPRLLDALGADVVPIHITPDGLFPRPAEPLPENLGALCEAVRAHGCDVGFAQDMDADRLAVVDEHGTPIGEELTLVLAAWFVLGRTPGPVVANLSTTSALDAVAARFGCTVGRSKIGEANVTERMRADRAVIGGEGNGGVIYPAINFGRDSLVGMALILHLLAASGRTVSQLVGELPPFRMVKDKITCPSGRIPDVLRMVKRDFGAHRLDTRDGVKVVLDDGRWFLVRGSNTEPIVRVVAEAASDADARALVDDLMSRVTRTLAG
jgi:phosphomannomutase